MIRSNDIFLVNKFPDFKAEGFDIDAYNQRFKKSNIIINACSADVAYPEHWGCLSVKCAFGGSETYKIADRRYSVNDDNYFICNDGEYYSSSICAKHQVESFTLNFSHDFVGLVAQSLLSSECRLIDQPVFLNNRSNEFIQRLYPHNGGVSNAIFQLRALIKNFNENKGLIVEQYHLLLKQLFLCQQHTWKEIKQVNAAKLSTQRELYKRLHYAKDYIESCYMEEITLDQLAGIACLNSAYLLRKFKEYFKRTPYQYLIKKRMEVAAGLLLNNRLPVTEICFSVGYADASSFCKLFKKHYCCSPESYRIQNSKKVIFHT